MNREERVRQAKGMWQRLMVSILRLVVLIYLGLFIFGQFFVGPLIYPRHPSSYDKLPGLVFLTTADQKRIAAVWSPVAEARLTIIYSHGNGEDMGDDVDYVSAMNALGFSVFAYDYHGYGRSEGVPGELAVKQDIEAGYDYLTGVLHIPPEKIIVHGRSLGSGPAIYLASQKEVGGLIVESGYLSVFRVKFPWLWLPNDQFVNIHRIGKVRCPILFIHGTNDQIIPWFHGQRLFEAAPEPKRSLWVKGAGHNDIQEIDPEEYRQTIIDFAKLVLTARVA